MQETYDRIMIPKIVVCSRSSITDGCVVVDSEDCEKKSSPKHRRNLRSRNRRNSRRLSIGLLDRRSSSSSRSPSPCTSPKNRSSNQDQDKDKYQHQHRDQDKHQHKNQPQYQRLTQNKYEQEQERQYQRQDQDKYEHQKYMISNEIGQNSSRVERDSVEKEVDPSNCFSGYQQYLQLLKVPQSSVAQSLEWGECSGDDLSSEWDSDYTDSRANVIGKAGQTGPKSSGWRKLRNIVHWTPFFQTYKKQRYPWVQLAGHQGNFRAGPTPGTILKKLCPQEEACFRLLMNDVLRPYVPEFKGVLDIRETEDGTVDESNNTEKELTSDSGKRTIVSSYLQLQDLLGDFEQPCVMDCKVGVRTYLESELAKAKERPKLRKDMYEKMMQVDPTAPNAEERRLQGITKPRYMVWRETISSTATLGFRVEGIKLAHGGSSKDFKTTRTREQVTEALSRFVEGYPHAVMKYLQRLKAIRATLKASPFFASHEVVGSSLLFVHDTKNAGVWLIDFAKTLPLPQHLPRIRHDAEWHVGNHEDGYLIGVNNLIDIFEDIRN